MQSNRRHPSLALVGFMGTGKSTVGHVVAHQLGFEFLDTDEVIEVRSGLTIPEIFAIEGEASFRRREAELAQELATCERTVISTGGGFIVSADNLAALKQSCLVVCLWASPETIFARVRHQTHRPLLAGPDAADRIRELLARREGHYRQADVLINTDLRSTREVAQQVCYQYSLARH